MKPVKLRLKIDLVSYPARAEGLGKYDKDARRKTSLTIYVPLTLFQGFEKGYSKFACERELETEQKLQYFDPYSYGCQLCAFLVLLMLNRRPSGPALCWMMAFFTASYPHLINIFSRPQLIRTPSPFGLMWLSLPPLVYNSSSNCNWNPNCLTSVLTELYNSSTPTRSLKSHV